MECTVAPVTETINRAHSALNIHPKTITVAISGCSSSGKSTLAFLLSSIFPASFTINQDKYYRPSTTAPRVTFTSSSSAADLSFIQRSLHVREYPYTYTEIEPGAKWKIEGPNLDHADAIDFKSLADDVAAAKNGEASECAKSEPVGLKAESQALAGEYGALISELRSLVGELKARICFVEGHLLFPDPEILGGEDRKRLMGLFDVKIFLPVDKEEAKRRRFKRSAYIDVADNGKRAPGMMARSEGYFEHVVWPSYEQECRWIEKHGEENGVISVPFGVVDCEQTVRWAVDLLMRDAANKEQLQTI